MTMEQFIEKLKALLREAEDGGIPTEDMCALVEHIIATNWEDES